jgi:predicted metal-dependent phosphoesterase TrpH
LIYRTYEGVKIDIIVDLHSHTTFSDGDLDPAKLVKLAHESGLRALSVTDHDTVEGLDIVEKECVRRDLTFIPGIEFTSKLDLPEIELHILGYGFDREEETFLRMMDEAKHNADDYCEKACSMLESHEWIIDHHALEKISGIPTRHDITQSVINKGMNNYEFHNKWLAETSPYSIDMKKFPAAEIIKAIHEAGGIAVCAHLLRTLEMYDEMKLLPVVTRSLIDYGLDGFEVFYGNSSKEQVQTMFNISGSNELMMTGGSDFHGPERTGRCLLGKYNVQGHRFDQRDLIRFLEKR